MKRNLTVVWAGLFVLFLSGNVFGRSRMGIDSRSLGRGIKGVGMGQEVLLFHYLNVDDQLKETGLQIARLRLDEREKSLDLRNKVDDLNMEIRALSLKAKSNPSVKKNLVAKMKQLNDVHKKLRVIREDYKDKIKNVRDSQWRSAQKKIDTWLDKIAKDDGELQRYLDFVGDSPEIRHYYHRNSSQGRLHRR